MAVSHRQFHLVIVELPTATVLQGSKPAWWIYSVALRDDKRSAYTMNQSTHSFGPSTKRLPSDLLIRHMPGNDSMSHGDLDMTSQQCGVSHALSTILCVEIEREREIGANCRQGGMAALGHYNHTGMRKRSSKRTNEVLT